MSRKSKSIRYYLDGIVEKAGRTLVPRYKRRMVTLFRYTGALGDALFLTTLAREVKKRNPAAIIHVITGLPQVFERNPDVDLVTPYSGKPIPGLGKFLVRYEHRFPWKQHLLNECARCVDIFDEIDRRVYIFPSEEDKAWAAKFVSDAGDAPVLICRSAGPRTDKKNWPDAYWRKLIPVLLNKYRVVEVGAGQPIGERINHTHYTDLTGKTTLHQLAALMSLARLLICPVTGLLHLSSASGIPVICIAGGSEPALATSYPNTRHLVDRPACSDCYEQGPCTYDFRCLLAINPETVIAAAEEILKHEHPATPRHQ
jgi:ADP-heptose:LPS heptosyltransferase